MRTQRAVLMTCAAAGLGMFVVAAAAQESQAEQQQQMPCPTAQFSKEVLDRFPQARAACLYLAQREGEPYAVYRAEVAKVHDDGVEVRFKMPNGGVSERHYIKTKPELRVEVGGKAVEVKDLAVGQDILAYVKVREPLMELDQPPGDPPARPVALPPGIPK
jgi:hypothetical protein